MSQMIDRLVRIDPSSGRGVMRNEQTGSEYSVILGRAANAGATLVAFADISGDPIPAPSPYEGSPEEVQAAAIRDQEELRVRRTAEARGLSPDEATAADLFPGGQAPTALPTLPDQEGALSAGMTGYEQGVAGGVAAPLASLDEAERQELEAYRQRDAEAQAAAQEAAGIEGVEQATEAARAEAAAAEETPVEAEAEPAPRPRRRSAARAKAKD